MRRIVEGGGKGGEGEEVMEGKGKWRKSGDEKRETNERKGKG